MRQRRRSFDVYDERMKLTLEIIARVLLKMETASENGVARSVTPLR